MGLILFIRPEEFPQAFDGWSVLFSTAGNGVSVLNNPTVEGALVFVAHQAPSRAACMRTRLCRLLRE